MTILWLEYVRVTQGPFLALFYYTIYSKIKVTKIKVEVSFSRYVITLFSLNTRYLNIDIGKQYFLCTNLMFINYGYETFYR